MAALLAISIVPVMSFAKCHYGESTALNSDGPFFGPVTCDAGEISSLIVFGPAKTNGTIIKGDVKVMGLFEGESTQVFGKFSVFGAVKIFESTLEQDAMAATNYALLSHSTAESLLIKSDTSAELHLENNSVINGTIKFDSKYRGKVHLENGSVIRGQIINGDVVS